MHYPRLFGAIYGSLKYISNNIILASIRSPHKQKVYMISILKIYDKRAIIVQKYFSELLYHASYIVRYKDWAESSGFIF